MSRSSEYQFITTDTSALVSELISSYEQMTGMTVMPASPERLFIQWIASVIIQERVLNNYTANQNIPSRSHGANLDTLGEELYNNVKRPTSQAAISTQRFHISEVQNSAILIPGGTKITDKNNALVWETTADVYIDIGQTYVDAMIQCQTPGTIGNGYTPGQINTLIDLFPYYDYCENVTESNNGSDAATDEEYYNLLRASTGSYSTAGPDDAYIYYAKQVSTQITDIVTTSPSAGQVNIYALMSDGTPAGTEVKNAIYEACNAKSVRPLTDYVVIDDPEVIDYDIEFTYYMSKNTLIDAAEVESSVSRVVEQYTKWQNEKLGRDINPSYLYGQLMQTGIKRVEIVAPLFTSLRDGTDNLIPQVGAVGNILINNGGYEDE